MESFTRLFTLLTIISMIAGLTACQTLSTQQTDTEKTANDAGSWVWFDLVAHDVDQAQEFYSQVFGWQFEQTTVDGKPYNNTYCQVITIRNGQIAAVKEYMDTALIDSVFGSR